MKRFLAMIGRVREFANAGMWRIDVDGCRFARRAGLNSLRFLSVVGTGLVRHRVSLHAAGLTCFTLLALVPMLMLALLLTKPCGVYGLAREKLRSSTDAAIEAFFAKDGKSDAAADARKGNPSGGEYGKQVRELRDQLLSQVDERVENFDFGAMAIVGVLMLAWTVVSMFGQVEGSFNELWNVLKGRPLWKRFVLYATTLTVLPPLLTLAMSMPVLKAVRRALNAVLGDSAVAQTLDAALTGVLGSFWFGAAMLFLFMTMAFAFLFWAMPNRPVRVRSAIAGGGVTALTLVGWVKVCTLLQIDLAKSGAAWGSFALVPILIVAIFMSWRIILLGSTVTYAFECVHLRVRSLPFR